MSFDYNSSGLRTKKTVNGEEKQYFYSGDLLVSEYDGVEYTNFTYGPNGEPVGFSFFDVESNEPMGYYYYLKNIQGDIIGLIDFKGEIECTYSYDAWGKFLGAYDENGNEITNPYSAALSNPLRYRGYYYDDETGLYYLNSRYYNPEWGTFICADGYVSTGEQIVAKNMYAYCLNNPVNYADPSGMACICRTKRVWRDHVCTDNYVFGYTVSLRRETYYFNCGWLLEYSTGFQGQYEYEENNSTSNVTKTVRTNLNLSDDATTGKGVRLNLQDSNVFEVGYDLGESSISVYALSINSKGLTREGSVAFDYGCLQLKISGSKIASLNNNADGSYYEFTINGVAAVAVGVFLVASFKGTIALATATTVGAYTLSGNAT